MSENKLFMPSPYTLRKKFLNITVISNA